jgi:hypothetical protein
MGIVGDIHTQSPLRTGASLPAESHAFQEICTTPNLMPNMNGAPLFVAEIDDL